MKYVFVEGKKGEHPMRDTLEEVVQDVINAGHVEWFKSGARKGRHGKMIIGIREKTENAADTAKDQTVND